MTALPPQTDLSSPPHILKTLKGRNMEEVRRQCVHSGLKRNKPAWKYKTGKLKTNDSEYMEYMALI